MPACGERVWATSLELTPIIAATSLRPDTAPMRLVHLILAASALLVFSAPALAAPGTFAAGRKLAQKCAPCHAVGLKDASRDKAAPPFRTLAQKYPLDSLQEALAEGIIAGHTDDMPQFRMKPAEVDAFLTYLESIQR